MALVRIFGHVIAIIFLFAGIVSVSLIDWIVRSLVGLIQTIFGATIERDSVKFHPQRETVEPVLGDFEVINEGATREASNFPISPADLIAKTKKIISVEFGSKEPDVLAEDFQFVFPIVGPLAKMEFCTIFGGFKLKDAFPDSKGNYFGFTVDPTEPNRVWFFSRAKMTHSGDLKFGAKIFPATGKQVVNTPQLLSMSFDREGRCYKFTGGYSIDRTVGNCGGLGGVLGIIYSVGGSLPFPEAKPWKPSLEWEAYSKRIPEIGKEWKKLF